MDSVKSFDKGLHRSWASLVAQRLKRLPAVRETWVRSLGREDPLENLLANAWSPHVIIPLNFQMSVHLERGYQRRGTSP